MKNNLLWAVKFILSILFWLAVWQILAMIIDHPFLLPSIPKTVKSLLVIIKTAEFYKATFLSILRVITGLLLGVLLGIVLAILSHKFSAVKQVLTPFISVIRSTPIASIIIILYIMMSGDALTVLVAVLMVMPVIWQNLSDAFLAIPSELSELCTAYEFSLLKKTRYLIFPTLLRYFIPAVITASGLCWKASISAEIIAYTKNSIGQHINDAKNALDSPTVFAWTVVVILLSILLEKLTKKLLERCKKWL